MAFRLAGGDTDALCTLLNDHLPTPEYTLAAQDLNASNRFYSLEFHLYVGMFAKLLLADPCFCYRPDDEPQLDAQHLIIEQGPLKYTPWCRLEAGQPPAGYLSITNMRSMFTYVEEAVPLPQFAGESLRSALGMRLAREGLEYLNACAAPEFRVERSFFDNEEVLISFEYLFYISHIFMCITNDPQFVYNSLYYGTFHSNQLARSIFLQPTLSPVEGLRQWQARTNHVYNMEFRQRGRRLWIRMSLTRSLRTGMFGSYRQSCISGISQACPAVHGAFMELATRNPVKANASIDRDDPEVLVVQLRWKAAIWPAWTVTTALLGGSVALLLELVIPELFAAEWQELVLRITAAAAVGVLTAAWVASTLRTRRMERQFNDTRTVIDEQFQALQHGADQLLKERDSLERKVAERTEELAGALDKLRELDQAKTNFIANVSHELRTPLTLIAVPLSGIRQGRYGDSLRTDHPVFNLIDRNIARLNRQIIQLLDFARLDLGTMPFEPHELPLVSYCRGLIAELQSLAERKNLILEFKNISGFAEIVVKADTALLETALLNLLDNALKFTDAGQVSLVIEAAPSSAAVLLKVCDTGIGFAAHEKEWLFQRFRRSEESATRQYEGTGLGLALTHGIAERHGWSIDAISQPGQGATFQLEIPVLRCEAACLGYDGAASGTDAAAGAPAKPDRLAGTEPESAQELTGSQPGAGGDEIILIVDDNPDMGTVLRDLLQCHYTVKYCSGGRQALACLENLPPVSLIICDVMMRGMSGFVFREQLRARPEWAEIPFIFLTALADPADLRQGLDTGALDYIIE
jgi:signal transduction histidine kinase/CheY-like chemotaxis protein